MTDTIYQAAANLQSRLTALYNAYQPSGDNGTGGSGTDGGGTQDNNADSTGTTTVKKRTVRGTYTGCFSAGTKIIMADQTFKNIENIKINDLVIAYNDLTNKY